MAALRSDLRSDLPLRFVGFDFDFFADVASAEAMAARLLAGIVNCRATVVNGVTLQGENVVRLKGGLFDGYLGCRQK